MNVRFVATSYAQFALTAKCATTVDKPLMRGIQFSVNKELKMKTGNTNYEKVAELDGAVIFADKYGYFLFEHYPSGNGWYSLPVRLGKTAKEVEESLTSDRDWCYRAWHGEMQAILNACEEVQKLPDIQ